MGRVAYFIFAALCAIAPFVRAAPPVAWVTHVAGTNFQIAGPTLLSPAGNVYFTGQVGTGAVFGTNAPQASGWFLAKHNAAGHLLWLQSSTRVFEDSVSTAFDAAENLYMTGVFLERAQFGDLILEGVSNQTHIFIVKFGPDGAVPWARALPRTDSENNPRLALAPAGGLYLARTEYDRDEDDPFIRLQR